MHTHILPISAQNSDNYFIPPEKYIHLPIPQKEWYLPGTDPISHRRTLHLTRGIHLINEWWEKQELEISFHIAADAFYLIEGIPELEQYVRLLHKTLSPHQKIDDCTLVFGNGATQLLNAALYAAALYHSIQVNPPRGDQVLCSTLYVTEQMPGYLEDNTLIDILHKNLLHWVPLEKEGHINPAHLLEFVTTPNNPDGRIRHKVTNAKYTLYDRVNHWSFFLNEDDSDIRQETLENDGISVFSLSKFLSFSASRVGYAFVKDPQVAHFMRYYIVMATHGLVWDSQYRSFVALQYLLEEPGKLEEYIDWIRQHLHKRWDRLRRAVDNTPITLLNTQGPTAWLQAPEPAEEYLMRKYQIEATYGPEYGATDDHARLNLLAASNQFEELIWRLHHL